LDEYLDPQRQGLRQRNVLHDDESLTESNPLLIASRETTEQAGEQPGNCVVS
jgi:hypothetical protein